MKQISLISILLLAFFFNNVVANQHDSLLNVFKTSKTTEKKIDAYLALSNIMLLNDLDSANKMLNSALKWSVKENYESGVANSYIILGKNFFHKGNVDSAKYFFQKSRKYSILKKIIHCQISASNKLGDIYNQFGENDSAHKYFSESLELAQQANDLEFIASNSKELGEIYRKFGDFEKTIEYYIKARKIYEETQDSVNLVKLYNSFGSVYQDIADFDKSLMFFKMAMELDLIIDEVDILYHILNNLGVLYWQVALDYDSARYFIISAIELNPKELNPINKQVNYINLGGIETDDKKYNKALEYYRKAQSLEIPYPSLYIQSALFINFGIAFNGLGQYDSARYYSFKGLKIAQETNTKMWIKNAYNTLYMADSAENRLDSAMYYLSKYHAMQDSLSSEETYNKISELEIRYETEKKEKENQELKKQNELNYRLIKNHRIIIVITVFAFIIFILYLATVLRSKKVQKKKNIELAKFNNKILLQQQQLENANLKLENQKDQLSELIITKDKFFSIIAHDLRSPFNSILGFLELLDQEFDDLSNTKKHEIIKTLKESSQNTYNLLLNLLDWSRSQRGMIKNKPKKINLSSIVSDAISMLQEASKKKELDIYNKIPVDSIVLTDPELTFTIFINLINNSIKFTPEKGEIFISAKEKGEFLEICIEDTGIGIPKDKIPLLFNLDCDYNKPGTNNEPGTGLGLIIVREFIDLMGSSIYVESELGKGSRFCFTLPKA